jgi:hypothetical protein
MQILEKIKNVILMPSIISKQNIALDNQIRKIRKARLSLKKRRLTRQTGQYYAARTKE